MWVLLPWPVLSLTTQVLICVRKLLQAVSNFLGALKQPYNFRVNTKTKPACKKRCYIITFLESQHVFAGASIHILRSVKYLLGNGKAGKFKNRFLQKGECVSSLTGELSLVSTLQGQHHFQTLLDKQMFQCQGMLKCKQ